MLAQLSRPFSQLEARKTNLVRRLEDLPEAARCYTPRPGAWSALEILDHLVLTEASILDAMIRSIPQRHPVSRADRVRGRLLELAFLTPVRFRVPARVTHVLPKGESTLAGQLASWEFVRRRMRETLEQVEPDALASGAFQHPVSGRMDVRQTLRFLSAHIVHHGYQLSRQLAAGKRLR